MSDAKHRQMALMLAPAREKLIGRDIAELCKNSDVSFNIETNELFLPSLGETIHIQLPDFVITQELDMWRHLTLLQYLDMADGTPLTGKGIALSEMRGGLSRGLGFDKDISLMFSRDLRDASAEDFARACEALGGQIIPGKADVSAVIRPSGTEPKLKLYLCVSAADRAAAEEKEARIARQIESVLKEKL